MRKALAFISACVVLSGIAFITVSPIEWRPNDIFGVNEDRALAFAILGGLFTAAYPRRWRLVALGSIGIACGLEVMQLLSETRHAQVEDALVKSAGAVAGIGLALLCREIWFTLHARRHRDVRKAADRNLPGIGAVFFDPSDGLLRLRFTNGEERLFAGVDRGAVTALLQNPEPMQYYRAHIESCYEQRRAA